MKRFEIDWPKIEKALGNQKTADVLERLSEVLERVKSGKAYETAQDGILRIQRTYNIEPQDSDAFKSNVRTPIVPLSSSTVCLSRVLDIDHNL